MYAFTIYSYRKIYSGSSNGSSIGVPTGSVGGALAGAPPTGLVGAPLLLSVLPPLYVVLSLYVYIYIYIYV